MKTLKVVLLLLLGVNAAEAQKANWKIDTNCLVLYYYGYGHDLDSEYNAEYNPDSIMWDTCLRRGVGKVGPKYSGPGFQKYTGPIDTTLDLPWTAYDTTESTADCKDRYGVLYDSIGPFLIRKIHPDASGGAQALKLSFHFDRYVPFDSVYDACHFPWWCGALPEFPYPTFRPPPPEAVREIKHSSTLALFPQPAHDKLFICNGNVSSCEVLDVLGHHIGRVYFKALDQNISEAMISFLPSGVYFLKNSLQVFRLVVN